MSTRSCFVGGGSYPWIPKLLSDIARVQGVGLSAGDSVGPAQAGHLAGRDQ